MIWHDLLNNSPSPQTNNNGNQRTTPEKLLEVLEPFRKQISALVYNQHIETPFIQKIGFNWTINPRQHLLCNRKKKSENFPGAFAITS